VHHLVERRCDQAREADDVRPFLLRGVEDLLGGCHYAEIDHLVVVAAENDPDDVLADVVNVALDRGEDDLSLRPAALLLILHEGLQVGDRPLHRTRALDDLRQEHAARSEQVADDPHPVHEWALDHVERPRKLLPGLFGVLLDVLDDAVDEGERESLLDLALAPGQIDLAPRRLA
jgi:hypothetical protein